jgi:hypothetical protein
MALGRFAKEWAQEYEKETHKMGHKWVGKIIKEIWKYNRKRWEMRCKIANENNRQTLAEKNVIINERIQHIYSQYDNLCNIDKKMLSTPINNRIQMQLPEKIEWINRVHQVIKTGIQRYSKKEKKENISINTYFPVVRHYKNAYIRGTNSNAAENEEHLEVATEKTRRENQKPP